MHGYERVGIHQTTASCAARKHAEAWVRPIYALFFLSGVPALLYQLVWQRALFRIFGTNIESVTIVVTAFMLGLGLGGLAGGWLSKRVNLPLLPMLAVIELLTAAFGLASLDIFERFGRTALGLPLPATAIVTLLIVLLPTLLMGATLPVLAGHSAPRLENTGRSVGLLYHANTLGAGAACVLGAAALFPFVGMQRSVSIAAALNAVVAAAALVLHFRSPAHVGNRPSGWQDQSGPITPLLRFTPILGLAGFGGFVSLSYEIFFFRIMSYATGSSASSFAFVLGAFLVGIALGARAAETGARARNPGGRVIASSGHS